MNVHAQDICASSTYLVSTCLYVSPSADCLPPMQSGWNSPASTVPHVCPFIYARKLPNGVHEKTLLSQCARSYSATGGSRHSDNSRVEAELLCWPSNSTGALKDEATACHNVLATALHVLQKQCTICSLVLAFPCLSWNELQR